MFVTFGVYGFTVSNFYTGTEILKAGTISYSSMNYLCNAPWGTFKHSFINGSGIDSKTY